MNGDAPVKEAGEAIRLKINGTEHELNVPPDMPLLWALRETLGLTGTKYGCGRALCGACTVHVDGFQRRSCVTPVSDVVGSEITTIEGAQSKEADAVKKAWMSLDVPQCGYCQSGQIMSAISLLTENPNPDDSAIDAALAGNLCRCATYHRIRAAIKGAAGTLGA
ncbi:MAG: (2Fe-2S)-binding protein [Sphingobium sp.]